MTLANRIFLFNDPPTTKIYTLSLHDALPISFVRELTDGRGPDAVIDAVGMEAHGSPGAQGLQKLVGLMPDAVAEPMMKKDRKSTRLNSSHMSISYAVFCLKKKKKKLIKKTNQ